MSGSIKNERGFMGDDCPLELEYTLWEGMWGANVAGFRFQLGILVVVNGMVDKFFGRDYGFEHHVLVKRINLLEEQGGNYKWFGSYRSPRNALIALRDLLLSCENS